MAHDSDYARRFLGLLVKQAREEKEWNQQYLADELDIDIRTLRKVEDGKSNIGYNLLIKIIQTLNISSQILYYIDDEEKGLKMDRFFRQLLQFPLEDIAMIAKSAYLRRNCVDCGAQCCGCLRGVEIKHIREVLKAKVIIRITKATADQLV